MTDFPRFITLLLKDEDHTLTRDEFLEWHEMLHQYYGALYAKAP